MEKMVRQRGYCSSYRDKIVSMEMKRDTLKEESILRLFLICIKKKIVLVNRISKVGNPGSRVILLMRFTHAFQPF